MASEVKLSDLRPGRLVVDKRGRVRRIASVEVKVDRHRWEMRYSAIDTPTRSSDIRWTPVSGFSGGSKGGRIFAYQLLLQAVEVRDGE